MPRFPRWLYAHRGTPAELPENTLASFERAFELGADVLETDAHITSDGHVVLSHDADVSRTAGVAGLIARCTLSDVQRWDVGWGWTDRAGARPFAGRGFRIPSLEQALTALPTARFNIDLKAAQRSMAPAIVASVHRLSASDRVRLTSFSSGTLRRIRALGYTGPLGLGQADVVALRFVPESFLRRRKAFEATAAQIPVAAGPVRLDTRAFIAKCHELGVRVDYWTINDEDQARALLALGADGIVTDDPARLAPVVRSFGG